MKRKHNKHRMKKGSDDNYSYCSVQTCGVPLKTWEFGKCSSCKMKADAIAEQPRQTPTQTALPEKDTLRENIEKWSKEYDKSYLAGLARNTANTEKTEKGEKLENGKTFKGLSGMTDEEFAEYERCGMGGR